MDDFDEILALRQRILDGEAEIRSLRSQVQSLKHLLDILQKEALENVEPRAPVQLLPTDPPLIGAIRNRDLDSVRSLIEEHHVDPREHDDAAIVNACETGQLDVVDLLIKHGANVNVDGGCPLLWAVKNKNVRLATYLIEHGADTSLLNGCATRIAVSSGDHEMVSLLSGRSNC